MASRKEQKEAARLRRLEEERARADRESRQRRLRTAAGVVVGAIIVIVVAVVISSSGANTASAAKPTSAAARQASAAVTKLLAGIPQQGNVLGSPSAKVTVTEYGDLVCPVCKDFATGAESRLISSDVRSGKVKLVYKPLETASSTANGSMFVPSQTAVLAAGQQKHAWDYIELFYHEQGDETQSYVTDGYLQGLAQQIPGLSLSTWASARQSATLSSQVTADEQAAQAAGYGSTPTIVVSGPKGQAHPIIGNPSSFSQLQSAITQVS